MHLKALIQRPALLALVALTGAAWLVVFALDLSPYGQMMGHAAGSGHGSPAGGGSGQSSDFAALTSFTANWALMVVAMMLPVMAPFVESFSSSIDRIGGRAWPVLLLVVGYVLTWTAFGVGCHLAVQVFLQVAGAGELVGPAALLLAGAYQVSPFKRRALHRSCSPPDLALLSGDTKWRLARSLVLGGREGIACIGCCWALMLLMVVGVAGGSGGMLALGILMWAERNAPWGHRLVRPAGLLLIQFALAFGLGTLMGTLPWHDHHM